GYSQTNQLITRGNTLAVEGLSVSEQAGRGVVVSNKRDNSLSVYRSGQQVGSRTVSAPIEIAETILYMTRVVNQTCDAVTAGYVIHANMLEEDIIHLSHDWELFQKRLGRGLIED